LEWPVEEDGHGRQSSLRLRRVQPDGLAIREADLGQASPSAHASGLPCRPWWQR